MSKPIDLTGQRFGRLTVESRAESSGRTRWNCICDCGNKTVVSTKNLRGGTTKSCGCIHSEQLRARRSKIIPPGTVFERLTVKELVGQDENGNYLYRCSCRCGNDNYVVAGSILRKNVIKSCGCYNRERARTHGESKTRLYQIWGSMKRRCLNEKSDVYHYYGGRGITVCDEWKNSYEAFAEWARNNGYTDELTIDRIDVNGNYCPENCRWVTKYEQTQNRRPQIRNDQIRVTVNGETHTLSEWSQITGISQPTLYYRYKYHGDVGEQFTRPLRAAITQPR